MGKFYGPVGFATTGPTSPGVWKAEIVEKPYSGDVLQNYAKFERGENLNDDLNVDVRISIVSNAFADQNFSMIKYVVWRGAYWKVIKADPSNRPRLVLTIGGVYNGPKA